MATNNTATQDLFVTYGSVPPFGEMTRQGNTWSCISAAGTPLVVIPTTLCILELFNNTASGMQMVVEDLFLFELLGTAAVHNQSIWAMVTPPKAIPTLSAVTIGSASGRNPYTPTVGSRVVPAAATTVVANGWEPFGAFGVAATQTATPGAAWRAPVDGKLVVPPGCSLAITCVDALATASSCQVGARWVEVPITGANGAASFPVVQ